MQVVALTALAIRELWISFRLLVLLGIALAGGMLAAVLPDLGGGSSSTLAWAMGGAGILASALAAAALATERRRGMAGWLVLRSVPRSSLVIAWFVALGIPLVIGMGAAAALAWLTVEVASVGSLANSALDALAFAALTAAAVLAVLQALALGLVLGTIARPLLAAVVAAPLSMILLIPSLLIGDVPTYVPGSGLGLLGHAERLAHPLSDGLGSTGIGLAILGATLLVAAAFLERAEL
jgi:hypothetical protein